MNRASAIPESGHSSLAASDILCVPSTLPLFMLSDSGITCLIQDFKGTFEIERRWREQAAIAITVRQMHLPANDTARDNSAKISSIDFQLL